jgi:lipoprotein-releasing system ATP-binding protein
MNSDLRPILKLSNIRKTFTQGENIIEVLKGINLEINRGEIVALVGPSGSGKSTLLQIAGLLDDTNSGEIIIGGENFSKSSDAKRTIARRKHIGFVYQFHHLLPEFDALENVVIPQLINGVPEADAIKKADELLASMGLSDRKTHRPGQLSGGQQQRVAIARAMANSPSLLLADEPTGNLDTNTSDLVFDSMRELIRRTNSAALIATHNPELVSKMDRVLRIVDGAIV